MQLKLIKFFLLGSVCSLQVGKKNAHSLIAFFYYQEACVLHTPCGGIIKILYLQCEVFIAALGNRKNSYLSLRSPLHHHWCVRALPPLLRITPFSWYGIYFCLLSLSR